MNPQKDFFVNPLSDLFIKYLFGMDNPESKKLVLSFINAVLKDADFEPIVSVIQKNPFNYSEHKEGKVCILDIKAKSETGKLINIEVQSSLYASFDIRSLYYWSQLYASQLHESDEYHLLQPVICINVLNFTLYPTLPDFHLSLIHI